MKTIYFVTSNKGKVLEAKKKLSELDIKVIQKDIGYPEIQTDDLKKVVDSGIEHVKEKLDYPFILEDAGLFIDSLEGFPGVFSAYIYHTIGCNGILKLMENVENRKAVFKSVYGYYNNKKKKVFIGECKGFISKETTGNKGFGYDPIFLPVGKNKTFAQMTATEKNKISHRGKALDKLADFFKKM